MLRTSSCSPQRAYRAGRRCWCCSTPTTAPTPNIVANGEIMADFAVTRGKLTRQEANAWLADLHQVGSEGRYFLSLNRYLFLATR
jgi:hypothetical protein